MRVEINNIEWDIIFTNNTDDLKRSDGSVTFGVTDVNVLGIFIWSSLRGRMLRKVMIHELSHAFIFSYGYFLTLEEEEFLCSFIDTYAEDIISYTDSILTEAFKEIRKFS